MNQLIAFKRKGKVQEFVKLISEKEVFETPEDLAQTQEYNCDYKLSEDEWFIIDSFTQRDYCIDFLKKILILLN